LPIIQARRAQPQDDVISLLCAAEVEGHRLDDEDILAFIRLLFPAGADTTYLTLGSMFNAVLGDATIVSQLVAQPKLIPAAVEESLRLFGTVCLLPRYTVGHRTCLCATVARSKLAGCGANRARAGCRGETRDNSHCKPECSAQCPVVSFDCRQ